MLVLLICRLLLPLHGMRMQSYDIIPGLQPYVKLICTMDCDDDTDTSFIRVLPDACVELFLNYTSTPVAMIDDELYKGSIATFRMSKATDIQMRKGAGVIAICFHPGMAYPFIHVPMHKLSDTIIDLTDVWDMTLTELEEKIAESDSSQTRVQHVQQYLLKKLGHAKDNLHILHCLKQVQLSEAMIPAGKLADDTGLSQRHLARKFQEHVGLSPKEYLRVSRFIFSLSNLKKYPVLSLTEIAFKSGYYDQAHFVRDYKGFTGHTPGQIIRMPHILY